MSLEAVAVGMLCMMLLKYNIKPCSVFSRPRSEGWLHHRRTFSIYLSPLSF